MLEIHSRKSQGHRNKVSEKFRNGEGLIMFTSDVSARGMDYPDVTAVLQVRCAGVSAVCVECGSIEPCVEPGCYVA